jgi:signal transduction histidine kinase
MAVYNVHSLFVFYSLVSLLGGAIAVVCWRNLDTSARYWTVATLIAGVTNLATVFRAELPLLWSYSIPIGLTGALFVLMGLGIQRLHRPGLPWPALLVLAIGTVVFIAVMEWCRIHVGLRLTVVLSGGLFALTSFWSSYTAHVYHRLSANRFARHMCTVMIVFGVVNLLRIQSTFTGWGLETFGKDAWTLAMWSTQFLLGMLRYILYIAMRIQQSADQRRQAAVAQAREDESRRLSLQLAQQERQHGLGIMSASFAHELNQPLAVIRNYSELLQHQLRTGTLDAGMAHGLLDEIIANNIRAAEIIRRIRNFIQPAKPRMEAIDLREVVQEVLALVAPELLRRKIELLKPTMPNPVWLRADAIELSQVLFNVLRNAMEAVQGADQACIELALKECDVDVQLRVYDSGPGLSEGTLAQAGEPFFTTKASGLGMGLSISKSILDQYGGRLTLSNTARGTCALVCLPRADRR